MKVLDKVFPAEMNVGNGRAPLAVTVFFGANDACLPDRCSAFQHVPIDEYRQNLHAIVAYLKVLCILNLSHFILLIFKYKSEMISVVYLLSIYCY